MSEASTRRTADRSAQRRGKASGSDRPAGRTGRSYEGSGRTRDSGGRTAGSTRAAAALRRKRLRRRKKIRRTVFLLFLMAVLFAGGSLTLYFLRNGVGGALSQPYSASREFTSTFTSGAEQRAKPFAADLCIVKKDVPLESATLEAGQEGLLLDLSRKKVLFSRGAFDRVYPASITKIMTAMLALKYGDLDETVTITQENVTLESGSQVCGFRAGDKVTMDQLLHCLLVYSGNDAAAAIAEHIGGSEAAFVDMMNQYAAQLGCTGTHFANPHGLHDENHYTTPYDIYLLLKEALTYPLFMEITRMPSYTVNYTRADGTQMSTSLEATDHYLTGEAIPPKDVTVLGGKTGTTSDAGNCLALLSQNAYGQPFVAVVMGASSKGVLYQQMNSLLQNIN